MIHFDGERYYLAKKLASEIFYPVMEMIYKLQEKIQLSNDEEKIETQLQKWKESWVLKDNMK